MRRLLWVAAWSGVAVWSLFAFAAYGFVDVIGGVAMRNADALSADPGTVEQLFNLFGWVRGFSTSAILVVWGFVSLAILAVPWLFDRLSARVPVPAGPTPRPRAMRDGVLDLGPGEYTVGRPDPVRTGPAPRIGPRP